MTEKSSSSSSFSGFPSSLPTIEFTREHQHALTMVDAGRNILITGPAGTGKTTLLKEIMRRCGIENMMLTGPTGVSALQLQNGKTLHSALKIPVGSFPSKDEITKYYQKLYEKNKLKIIEGAKKGQPKNMTDAATGKGEPWFVKIATCRILIIDEISMVSAWMMEYIDTAIGILRDARHLPFGGVQVIFVGDFLQLPPVYNKKEKNVPVEQGQLAFQSPVWSALRVERILLTKVFRQQNSDFAEMLNAIRKGEKLDFAHQQYLNQLIAKNPHKSGIATGGGTTISVKNIEEIIRAGDATIRAGDATTTARGDKSEMKKDRDVDDDDDDTLYICFKRDDVKDINARNIAKLRHLNAVTHHYKFPFKSSGSGVDTHEREDYVKDVRENLNLSRNDTHQTILGGMRVMLVRNMTIDGRYFSNGSIGTVVGFGLPPPGQNSRYADMDSFPKTRFPVVEFDSCLDELLCTILPASWGRQEIFDGKIRTKIEVDAIPLIPAWAITSHRAQGSTIDDIPVHIHADCMNFAEGSFYVAISRCRTFDQLSIGSFTGFKQNRQAAEFYKGVFTSSVPKTYPQQLSLKDDVFKDFYVSTPQPATSNVPKEEIVTQTVVATDAVSSIDKPDIITTQVDVDHNPFQEWAKKTFKRAKKEPSETTSAAFTESSSGETKPTQPSQPIEFKPRVKATKRHVEKPASQELLASWKIIEPVLDEFVYNHMSEEDQVRDLFQKWIQSQQSQQ
jgi:hypothetical protein